MSDIINQTRGDAFDFTVDWQPAAGAPATVEAMTITSQVRKMPASLADVGELVAEVAITKHPDFMGWDAVVLDASAWPLGQLEWDFKCVIAGRVVHSSKVLVNMTRAVTQ